jgi:hypothetical protein
MRNTFAAIATTDLANVIGGCGKKAAPPPPQPPPQAAPPPAPRGADITVATGAQGGAAIQQALQGGF